ncbi:MAG TPA: alpha/beta fold hydrolase [Verrucomicrobiae bacterium]|nr:alpha/beta fold hydrolase [Verrucomicrobiae bacterium]
MRRSLASVAALAALAFTACSAPHGGPGALPGLSSFARPLAAPARGSVISIVKTASFGKGDLNGGLGLAGQVITALGGAPQCGVDLYAVTYNTIGVAGEPATASAGFFVPGIGCKGPFTLIGYGQGTNVVRAQKITHPTPKNIEPPVLAAIFAAHGYAIAATDYLGLGYSNYPFQPYLVVNSEASAVIDAMRAIRIAAARLHVPLSGKVFLTGHSQGGQTALGTQKVIEATLASEFDLIGDSPSSGPYALTQTTLDGLKKPGENAAIYSAYILTAYHKTYKNGYTKPVEVFRDPYAKWVENLLPVATYREAAGLNGKSLPLQLSALLQPSFVKTFSNDAKNPARVDLALNDLLDGWKPKAPVYLCGGDRDPMVEFKNSLLAYRYFKGLGVKVSLLDVNSYMPPSIPITGYHDAVLVLCHTLERVRVLDAAAGIRRPAGTWPQNARGSIGPFESATGNGSF